MRGDWYQFSLITLGVVVTAFFGVFFWREIAPEYKIYQEDYVALEKFRSSYTHEPPPPFEMGIKQILIERADNGPPTIDRCTSCHVALQFSHFSPTKIARDINGNIIADENGIPKEEPNENYVWARLYQRIAELRENNKIGEAEKLQALKTAEVDGHIYDVTKVLQAHPLIGRETRPFEYHPPEEYGCTTCHSGNGRGLTTQKAHGPVFDGQYEGEYMGPKPEFLEADPKNDPLFSRVFNEKPGHELIFQTTPLLVGSLIQANCVKCHSSAIGTLRDAVNEKEVAAKQREKQSKARNDSFLHEVEALSALVELSYRLEKDGTDKTVGYLRKKSESYDQKEDQRKAYLAELYYVEGILDKAQGNKDTYLLAFINRKIENLLGSKELSRIAPRGKEKILAFVKKYQGSKSATGALFAKADAVEKDQVQMFHVQELNDLFEKKVEDKNVMRSLPSEMDRLIQNFHRGESLFISQACYACHRINELSRGGVGPELTNEGNSYPWFVKESIVWPQADLKTSTMPNFRLDHLELQDLVTFLLAQKGRPEKVSEVDYKIEVMDWEAGKKMPWEKEINPGKLHDLRYSMSVFATEGCAACHKLKGFESDVGYSIEKKGEPDFETQYLEKKWFTDLFPENIAGSDIVKAIEDNQKQIDERIVDNVRKGSILEELEEAFPELLESFYSNFRFAARAKNYILAKEASDANTPEGKEQKEQELKAWKARVKRVQMMFIQEYGLGRLIGPRPNWSGIYRSDEWLIEHFRKPTQHIPRSIMPVFPFDDTKFYALTYMLDVLAQKNRKEVRQIWENFGFDPALAYQIHCSQCHGEYLHGNGPVAEWIYPIPKNLRNSDFLRNFTKDNVIDSITHGVKGTPMPPWGETAPNKPVENDVPVLKKDEIYQVADWIFSGLLGGTVIRSAEDVPKWRYDADDAVEEMIKEGSMLKTGEPPEFIKLEELSPKSTGEREGEKQYLAMNNAGVPFHRETKPYVEQIFNINPNPIPGPEKDLYYIKKKYYTEENIEDGRNFFELNCAVCHGKEADGLGYRAGTMYDAKPRMLTNLHWIDTRDDIRLIRSIKFGVPGTAMTPWGDMTSSLQRIQLVIFIRSLSMTQEQRDNLRNQVFEAFDVARQTIDVARIDEYTKINEIEDRLKELNDKRAYMMQKIAQGEAQANEAVPIYQEELKLTQSLKEHEKQDQLLEEITSLVKKQSENFQIMGVHLIMSTMLGEPFDHFLKIIELNKKIYQVQDGNLKAAFDPEKEKEMEKLQNKLLANIDRKMKEDEREREILQGKLPSEETKAELKKVEADLKAYQKLKNTLMSGFVEALTLRDEQKELYKNYEAEKGRI